MQLKLLMRPPGRLVVTMASANIVARLDIIVRPLAGWKVEGSPQSTASRERTTNDRL